MGHDVTQDYLYNFSFQANPLARAHWSHNVPCLILLAGKEATLLTVARRTRP